MFKFYAGRRMHQKRMERLLALNNINTNKVQSLKVSSAITELTLIGVQMCQSNTGKWKKAKLSYDLAMCYKMMQKIDAQLYNCIFIVCANENLNFNNTANLHLVYIGQTDAMNNFLLSKCKYIIAHSNSFFTWIEFMIGFLKRSL